MEKNTCWDRPHVLTIGTGDWFRKTKPDTKFEAGLNQNGCNNKIEEQKKKKEKRRRRRKTDSVGVHTRPLA